MIPSSLKDALDGLGVTMALAALGRLMWHAQEVQAGHRRFWSLNLVWEGLIAVGVGFMAAGIADYAGLEGRPALGAIIFISYLGPRGIGAMLMRFGWIKKP